MPDSGVVDDDVGHAVGGADFVGEALHRIGIGDVEHVGVGHPATRGDLGRGVLGAGLVDVADDHLGALPCELERRLAADAAARAGHGNQCVAEWFAGAAHLGAQQAARGRGPGDVVDELRERPGEHRRVRQG